MKHGTGTDIFANGDFYTGDYIDGRPHGKGQYSWANGATYVGEFLAGMKHGEGKWRSAKSLVCNSYEG